MDSPLVCGLGRPGTGRDFKAETQWMRIENQGKMGGGGEREEHSRKREVSACVKPPLPLHSKTNLESSLK